MQQNIESQSFTCKLNDDCLDMLHHLFCPWMRGLHEWEHPYTCVFLCQGEEWIQWGWGLVLPHKIYQINRDSYDTVTTWQEILLQWWPGLYSTNNSKTTLKFKYFLDPLISYEINQTVTVINLYKRPLPADIKQGSTPTFPPTCNSWKWQQTIYSCILNQT